MKQKAVLLVVACALLLVMVVSSRSYVNPGVTTANINPNSARSIWADGGTPVPPFPPPGGSQLVASSPVAWADGGTPVPPFPPPGGQLA